MDSINVLTQQGGNNARISMLKVIMLLHHTLYHKKGIATFTMELTYLL